MSKKPSFGIVGEKVGEVDLHQSKVADKMSSSPLVIAAGLAVTGALGYGMTKMMNGNTVSSGNMMRWRVLGQGAAVGALLGYAVYHGITHFGAKDEHH